MQNYQQVISANTLIHTGKGYLAGLVVSCDTETAGPAITCYDNTSASGTIIFKVLISNQSIAQPFTILFPERYAPRFDTGLYIAVVGAVVNLWATGA